MSEPIAIKNCTACLFLRAGPECGAPYSLIGCGSRPEMYTEGIENELGRPFWHGEVDAPPHPACPMRGRAVAYTWPAPEAPNV